jgi:hypothetical protein
MVNVVSDTQKQTLEEEILEEIAEEIMEKIIDMVSKNVQLHSRNFKTPKIRNMRRHRNK